MIRRAVCAFCVVLSLVWLTACWNYRGLDELTIVAGMAIDKNPQNGNYHLTFEIVDVATSTRGESPRNALFESEGNTLFEAVRNANKRVANKLYFGHTQIILLNQDMIREGDIGSVLDWAARDGEVRETMHIAVSQEKTAKNILKSEGIDQTIRSMKLNNLIRNDNNTTSSTAHTDLHTTYETLKIPGKDVVLPSVHNTVNDGKPACEINGIAIFRGENLVGFLPPEETKYFLFAVNSVKGGILAFSSKGDGTADTSLEISNNFTKCSVKTENGQPKILIETETNVFLGEYMQQNVELDENKITELERLFSKELTQRISAVIKKVQSEYGADIFGFGNLINKTQNDLWKRIRNDWNVRFKTLEVEVRAKVHIQNTASLNRS